MADNGFQSHRLSNYPMSITPQYASVIFTRRAEIAGSCGSMLASSLLLYGQRKRSLQTRWTRNDRPLISACQQSLAFEVSSVIGACEASSVIAASLPHIITWNKAQMCLEPPIYSYRRRVRWVLDAKGGSKRQCGSPVIRGVWPRTFHLFFQVASFTFDSAIAMLFRYACIAPF